MMIDSCCDITIVLLDAAHKAVLSIDDADELDKNGGKAGAYVIWISAIRTRTRM